MLLDFDVKRRRGKTWIDARISHGRVRETLLIIIMLDLCAAVPIIPISVSFHLLISLSLSLIHPFPLSFCFILLLNHQQLNYHLPCCYKHTHPNQFFFAIFGRFQCNLLYAYIKNSDYQDLSFCLSQINDPTATKKKNQYFSAALHLFVFLFFNGAFYRCATTNSIINEV